METIISWNFGGRRIEEGMRIKKIRLKKNVSEVKRGNNVYHLTRRKFKNPKTLGE